MSEEKFVVQYTSKTKGDVFVVASKAVLDTLLAREAHIRRLGNCACVTATKNNSRAENQMLLSTLEETDDGLVDNTYVLQEVYA